MAGKIPERTIDEIRDRTDILSLIGKYVPLKKAGRNFVGLCPFHAEKTPSFSVNPEKGIYKCFGCGKGGSAINFLMEIEGMSFVEAVRDLGNRCGVRIQPDSRTKERTDDRAAVLYTVNEDARAYFAENLKAPEAKGAVAYLKKRGLDGETARLFQIGYAPAGWDGLISYFRHSARGEKVLVSAGLAVEGDRGVYDRFRDRIIFPIRDHRERCVGFGGRIVGPGEPKYLNSPETPVYHKGEVLYGLDITREEIRKAGYAVVVEGYLDLIALFQAGVRNVVATLGTALTKEHLKRLKNYTREVVLLFDPDEAGMKAAERTLPLFGEGTIYAKAAVLPENLDPDDFVRKNGAAAFYEIVTAARDLFDFAVERVFTRHNLKTAGGISLALDESASIVGLIHKKADQDICIAKVTERLGVREESVREAVLRTVRKEGSRQRKDSDARDPSPPFHPPAVEARLFKIAANFPQVLPRAGLAQRHLDLFEDEVLRELVGTMLETIPNGDIPPLVSLIDSVTDAAIRDQLIGLSFVDFDEIEDEAGALDIVRGCISHLEEKERRNKLKAITRQIKAGASKDAVNELLKQKMDYTKNLKR
ncbi:MAG: DNA primase [Deltaproteobacteria bacterium]|nr:DNA primase [Candidatus Zymogenaceae bacterium]